MNFSLTFLRIELVRQSRNLFLVGFAVAMPVLMYVIFGATPDYAKLSAGHANVAFTVMVSMAAYGVATVMSSLTAAAASEAGQGWGRQLALTPLGTAGYALTKVVTALFFAMISLGVVFLVGGLTGATADAGWRWWATAGLILLCGLMFGLFGLGVGLIIPSEAGVSVASIAMTFFAFLGNVFMPLSGGMLAFAHYTPMYGYVALVRWPHTEGTLADGSVDPLWAVLLNVAVWTLIFAGLVGLGVRRSRARR